MWISICVSGVEIGMVSVSMGRMSLLMGLVLMIGI